MSDECCGQHRWNATDYGREPLPMCESCPRREHQEERSRIDVSRHSDGLTIIRYGDVRWPSYSRWFVTGTIAA